MNKEYKIVVIGLGYVGLPLATLFASKYPVVGYDINQKRINELKQGADATLEVSKEALKNVLQAENPIENNTEGLYFTTEETDLHTANYYIITVPTPVDKNNSPALNL